MRISSLYWLIPFCCFLSGYYGLMYFLPRSVHKTPHLIGMSVTKALATASMVHINVHVLATVQDPLVTEDIIIKQSPGADSTIKEQQTIYVTVAQKVAALTMPLIVGLPHGEAQRILDERHITYQIHHVPSDLPQSLCCAQWPDAHTSLTSDLLPIHMYIPASTQTPVLWPNFIGKRLHDVLDFLHAYGINTHIDRLDNHSTDHMTIVVDQRPTPGSIIALSTQKAFLAQLLVRNPVS